MSKRGDAAFLLRPLFLYRVPSFHHKPNAFSLLLLLLTSAFFAVQSSIAAAPELKSLLPMAAAPGTTNKIDLAGKFDPWPPAIWSDPPGVIFTTTTNKSVITAEVSTDAAPGPRLIRFFNNEGVSEPRFFIVDPSRQLTEKEPNSHLAEAQDPGLLPVVINGRLNKNDEVDCYKISLHKGDWIEANLEAYTLMSKLDAVLKLVTTNNITLAWNHDYQTLDPHLWWQAPQDQTVIVQVFGFVYPANNDIRLYGGEEANYRLRLSSSAPPGWTNKTNDGSNLPFQATGTIQKIGQEDRYTFSAKKDQFIEARIEAAALGSPLDAWLKITDLAGSQLAQNDDAEGTRDPRLEWKAPADTNYVFVVGSTLNRGETNFHYRLHAAHAPPAFRATWTTTTLVLTNNTTNIAKFDLKRLRGHTNDLIAEFRDLPEGVTCPSLNLTNSTGEISLTLTATNAAPFQGPIRLFLLDAITKTNKPAIVELTTRGENNGVPNGYSTLVISSYDHLWLTVQTQAVVKEVAAKPAKE